MNAEISPPPPGRSTALLVVDMQREFLSAEGMLKRPVDGEPLLGPLAAVVV